MIILGSLALDISINVLLVVFGVVCILMSLLVLMQRPKQEGLGAAFGSQMTDQMFGARTTNVLQRGTVYLATAFFLLTLTLSVLMQKKNQVKAISAPAPVVAEKKEEAAPAPIVPQVTEKKVEAAPTPVTPAPVTPAPVTPPPAPAEAPQK